MKASLINNRLHPDILQEVKLSLSKDFVHYFRRSRSGQVHGFKAALTCLRSVETNLTLACPSLKSFFCNLPDSGRHVTSVCQGFSLSRSVGRVGENPGNEVGFDHGGSQEHRGPPATGRSQESLETEKLSRSIWYGSRSSVWLAKRIQDT